MNSRNLELLVTIKTAIKNGQLGMGDVAEKDIVELVFNELGIAKQGFDPDEYFALEDYFGGIVESCYGESIDNLLRIVDAGIRCLSAIPDLTEYMNTDYWKLVWEDSYSEEVNEVATYIELNGQTAVFNYAFKEKYTPNSIEVNYDADKDLLYVMYSEKRMYFPRGWEKERVAEYVSGILAEQDPDSPHCYEMEKYSVHEGDIVIDAGVAEGNFALSVVDKASLIYLVEADEEWIEVLKVTFENYKDKVIIIDKYLDCKTYDNHISLSDICAKANFIKMDIEGYEKDALLGGQELLRKSDDLRLAVCSYHCEGDELWIREFLDKNGFTTTTTKGYMFPDWEAGALKSGTLRRGLVFGIKG